MREMCYHCYLPKLSCLCSSLKPFQTNTKFVILIHPKELKKEKAGTGKLTKVSLLNSEMIDGVDFTEDTRVNELISDPNHFPMLLYPGEESFNLSENQFNPSMLEDKKLVVFILDGTWPCAKKMLKLSKNLQALPRLSFTPDRPSEFLIKQQPHKDCLSTIECAFQLIEALNKAQFEKTTEQENLLVIFRQMRDFYIQCASDPNRTGYRRKNYTLPTERKVTEKKRRLFYEHFPENEPKNKIE